MHNIGKKFLLHFYVLNSFYMFWAQVVSRMHEFYVSTVRFCALIIEILWKIYVTEFFYWRYHSSSCIDICDCIIDWANFSTISVTFSASTRSKILLYIYRKGASIVLQGVNKRKVQTKANALYLFDARINYFKLASAMAFKRSGGVDIKCQMAFLCRRSSTKECKRTYKKRIGGVYKI